MLGQFDTVIQGVKSGQVPAEALAAQLKAVEAFLPGPPPAGDGSHKPGGGE
jgi:hypothetical protein